METLNNLSIISDIKKIVNNKNNIKELSSYGSEDIGYSESAVEKNFLKTVRS